MRLFVGLGLLALLGAGCAHQADRPAPAAQPVPVGQTQAPAPSKAPQTEPSESKSLPSAGRVQPVNPASSPAAASVAEAAATGRHPERLTPMLQPPPFDAAAYARNPKPYLESTEPGRVFQTAQPGQDIPVLMPAGATSATLSPGQSVALTVKAPPGSPVSWLSTDLGSFSNSLVSITIKTDDDGICRSVFTATPGVSGRVNILAGSPMATGQVRFTVEVLAQGITPVSGQP